MFRLNVALTVTIFTVVRNMFLMATCCHWIGIDFHKTSNLQVQMFPDVLLQTSFKKKCFIDTAKELFNVES